MTQTPQPAGPPERGDSAVAVISAYGAYRVLLVLLAIWSFFAGFALFTGGLSDAVGFPGDSRTAERVVGLQMIAVTPVYGLIAWRREQYRLLVWIPYAMQIAIIVPMVMAFSDEGLLLLIVSAIFLVLLFYFWWHSHPLDFFEGVGAEEEGEEEYDDEPLDEEEEEAADEPGPARRTGRGSRSDAEAWERSQSQREQAKRPGRFRRRDG